MKFIFLFILSISLIYADEDLSYQDAIRIPTVKDFSVFTGLDQDRYLKQALQNKHWQAANAYFFNKRVHARLGNLGYATIPYDEVMRELKEAAEQGVVLAMFQGYRVSSMLTMKHGRYAKRDTAYFAKKMMEYNICLGYIETAYGYVHEWYSDKYDYSSANKILKAGQHSCKNQQLPKWIHNSYAKYLAQFKVMEERIK